MGVCVDIYRNGWLPAKHRIEVLKEGTHLSFDYSIQPDVEGKNYSMNEKPCTVTVMANSKVMVERPGGKPWVTEANNYYLGETRYVKKSFWGTYTYLFRMSVE